MKKLPSFGKIKRELDKLWSQAIRLRDGRCMVCGSKQKLNAHHCIVRRARSLATRWNFANGITLCYTCHMFRLHSYQGCDKEFLDQYMKAVNAKVSADIQKEIIAESRKIRKFSRDELMDMMKTLQT